MCLFVRMGWDDVMDDLFILVMQEKVVEVFPTSDRSNQGLRYMFEYQYKVLNYLNLIIEVILPTYI